ncbi:predicted protein [Streptomyces viridosporus ATCC 14672]|uniref:Predicted protein n=1 Tax=Streptomyces viridosporus (strain ATCC 14672 / DSM 40746 / JCM 4963 / KCTC 9882 / NRRL B-12104 / FH 1290) TaxID=566461 RepID=D5ZU87_STRV1|nr:predicted protein [Streptomyces viridosporus ATCC 14672]
MNDGLRWVFEAYPFGYSLVFCEHLTPEEVLERLGARRESIFPLTSAEAQEIEVRNTADEPCDFDHLEDLDVEAVEELGFLRREVDARARIPHHPGRGDHRGGLLPRRHDHRQAATRADVPRTRYPPAPYHWHHRPPHRAVDDPAGP